MIDTPDLMLQALDAGDEKTMDALSDVLRVIRLSGGVFLEAEFTAPWCISGKVSPEDCKPFLAAPRHVIAFHFVTSGRMRLRLENGDATEACAGEVVLLPHNEIHFFGSELNLTPVPASDIMQDRQAGGLARLVHGGGGEATRLVCGYLGCETPFNPLVAALPKILKLNVRTTASGAWIESSFRFAASEISARRVGSTTVMAKLSELLFVNAVSHFVENLPDERRGWLAGLRDPHVGRALALLHARPSEEWTAESVAREVGLSRSAFAERFSSLVGQPPMQYLALWRMHIAAQRLREGRRSVAQIGYDIGYESEAAFSRAFKRQFGAAPATWRKQSG
jgi:AraC-like DNA-binding protein